MSQSDYRQKKPGSGAMLSGAELFQSDTRITRIAANIALML
jgi:hypothetical protein